MLRLLNDDVPNDDVPKDDVPKDDVPNDDVPNDDVPNDDDDGLYLEPVFMLFLPNLLLTIVRFNVSSMALGWNTDL